MACPQVYDLQTARVRTVGQHHETIAGPDLVLRVILGLRYLGLNLLVVVPLEMALGLIMALVINAKIRGRAFFRSALYFPSLVSSAAV